MTNYTGNQSKGSFICWLFFYFSGGYVAVCCFLHRETWYTIFFDELLLFAFYKRWSVSVYLLLNHRIFITDEISGSVWFLRFVRPFRAHRQIVLWFAARCNTSLIICLPVCRCSSFFAGIAAIRRCEIECLLPAVWARRRTSPEPPSASYKTGFWTPCRMRLSGRDKTSIWDSVGRCRVQRLGNCDRLAAFASSQTAHWDI